MAISDLARQRLQQAYGITQDEYDAANEVIDAIDAAATEAFTPSVPGDWSPAPTTVQGALDQLAARVSALEP